MFNIKCSTLVRVFPITHALYFFELHAEGVRKSFLFSVTGQRAEVVGNGTVIPCGMLKCFNRQTETCRCTDFTLAGRHFFQHLCIVGTVDQHGNCSVIFSRCANQCRATDIDVLDGVSQITIRIGNSLFEGIQVNHHHVDGGNAMFLHHRVVGAAPTQDTAVNFRMQGLDATRHHFRETGIVGDFDHRYPVVGQQFGGTAGGQDLDPGVTQLPGEFHNT